MADLPRPEHPKNPVITGFFCIHRNLTARGSLRPMLHCHIVGCGRCDVRVPELAAELRLPVSRVLDELRARGEHIPTHLSIVPCPFVRELRELHPVSESAPDRSALTPAAARVEAYPEPKPLPRLKRRRRPGPKPVALDGFLFDEYGKAIATRRGGEASVREVAEALGLDRSTVRKWVQRGHLEPGRVERGVMVFRVSDAVAARDLVRERTLEAPGLQVNIPAKFHDQAVGIAEAAAWAHVRPATIRSWIHRGHIKPTNPGSRPTLLRVEDVFRVARGAKRARKYPGQ